MEYILLGRSFVLLHPHGLIHHHSAKFNYMYMAYDYKKTLPAPKQGNDTMPFLRYIESKNRHFSCITKKNLVIFYFNLNMEPSYWDMNYA